MTFTESLGRWKGTVRPHNNAPTWAKGSYLPVRRSHSQDGSEQTDVETLAAEGHPREIARPRNWLMAIAIFLLQVILYGFATFGVFSALRLDNQCASQPSTHLGLRPTDAYHHKEDSHPVDLHRGICNCGKTVEEAMHNACLFDPIQMAWLPSACRDDELIAEYNTLGDAEDGSWMYFDDDDYNVVLTAEQAANRSETGQYIAASIHWHITHCAYMWLKDIRAERLGIRVGHRLNTEMHARHCFRDVFIKGEPHSNIVGGVGITLAADWLPGDDF
ncbi:hypothetical protein F4777DRAFT_594081 [Nemania sp. FL0916]|nr:hypothetical protein F4777DRAFT_594081 [Nemania sp. FL0916]